MMINHDQPLDLFGAILFGQSQVPGQSGRPSLLHSLEYGLEITELEIDYDYHLIHVSVSQIGDCSFTNTSLYGYILGQT